MHLQATAGIVGLQSLRQNISKKSILLPESLHYLPHAALIQTWKTIMLSEEICSIGVKIGYSTHLPAQT